MNEGSEVCSAFSELGKLSQDDARKVGMVKDLGYHLSVM